MEPNEAPDGFEPLDLISGYSVAFGSVYLNRSERKLGFRVETSLLNPFGLCHGGAMATFADLQVIAVKDSLSIKLGFSPTVSMSVDYLSPARLGDWVEAMVTLSKATRSLIFTQALITVNGETVARATALHCNVGLDGRAAAKMGQSTARGEESTP